MWSRFFSNTKKKERAREKEKKHLVSFFCVGSLYNFDVCSRVSLSNLLNRMPEVQEHFIKEKQKIHTKREHKRWGHMTCCSCAAKSVFLNLLQSVVQNMTTTLKYSRRGHGKQKNVPEG